MKLLLKFNLVFLLIFAAGLAATGRVSWSLLERNARAEIAERFEIRAARFCPFRVPMVKYERTGLEIQMGVRWKERSPALARKVVS